MAAKNENKKILLKYFAYLDDMDVRSKIGKIKTDPGKKKRVP